MGGGSGGQKTESKAEYPEEFKPLAESARKQIEALQNALPLVSHAQFQPAGVAGLSPVEQFAIEELVMRTPYLPASFQSLMDLPEPVGAASQGAVRAGQGSKGAAGALDYLSGFLGRDVRPAPWAVLMTVVLSSALINNFVFTRYLGLCIFFGVSKKRRNTRMLPRKRSYACEYD